MKKRDQLKSRNFRALVRQRLAAGKSLTAIAKETGKSYKHVKQIAEQEGRSEDGEQNDIRTMA